MDGRDLPAVHSCLLVESDNLLYTDVRAILPMLRKHYRHLAGVAQSNIHFTASVFWVNNYRSLKYLTDFILSITSNPVSFLAYTTYISRKISKRVRGGHPPLDHRGWGLPPYSVNEMSMLSYFHETFTLPMIEEGSNTANARTTVGGVHRTSPTATTELLQGSQYVNQQELEGLRQKRETAAAAAAQKTQTQPLQTELPVAVSPYILQSFPLFPSTDGMLTNTKHGDFRAYVGPPDAHTVTDGAIGMNDMHIAFDSGSWGQYLGGTFRLQRNPGFLDYAHIVGRAMIKSACEVKLKCFCGQGSSRGHLLLHSDLFTTTPFTLEELELHVFERRSIPFHAWTPLKRSNISSGRLSVVPALPWELVGVGTTHTAPHVRCCAGPIKPSTMSIDIHQIEPCGPWRPLLSLHVHSKNTFPFLSKKCTC